MKKIKMKNSNTNSSQVPVTTIEEVMSMVDLGLKVRATHETKMNVFSSRSHTVFTLSVLQRDKVCKIYYYIQKKK